MMTVKEVSKLTGISARTLHYYDAIGLLAPTEKSEAGYRLYDDKALEKLQQILFFREFDMPLKQIKAVMDAPTLDTSQLLKMQKKMLTSKKERIDHLIAVIDDILKGEQKMEFGFFSKTEMQALFETMFAHMPQELRERSIQEFGSVEQWKKRYLEAVSREDVQKSYEKVAQWYGGKDKFLDAALHPIGKDVAQAYEKRIESILEKLIEKRDCPVDSFAVKELVGQYGFVMKQFCQLQEERGMMLAIAHSYRDRRMAARLDEQYGEGAAAFFAQAIETFYGCGK